VLPIRASGDARHPIYIGAYTDPTQPSSEPPKFVGDGVVEQVVAEDGSESWRVERSENTYGIRVWGASFVQIQDLQITNFEIGISGESYYEGNDYREPGYPTDEFPVRGARYLVLRHLKVFENWQDGIALNSNLSRITTLTFDAALDSGALSNKSSTGIVVVGDGSLQLKLLDTENKAISLLDIPVSPEGWWVEEVCIEDCEIYGNSDGYNSGSGHRFGHGPPR
jgi:hypothetical protein